MRIRNPGYVQQGLIVGTRKGSLRILRLREEGKKKMDAASFLNGHPGYLRICIPIMVEGYLEPTPWKQPNWV
jgi:Methionyl-tRNA formyltransferase